MFIEVQYLIKQFGFHWFSGTNPDEPKGRGLKLWESSLVSGSEDFFVSGKQTIFPPPVVLISAQSRLRWSFDGLMKLVNQ